MSEIEVTIKIPAPPEGWVYDGFRQAWPGEMCLRENEWELADGCTAYYYPVAVKVPPPWEPPQNMVNAILLVLGPGWVVYMGERWSWFNCKPTRGECKYGEVWSAPTTNHAQLPYLDHIVPPVVGRYWKIGDPKQ